MKKAILISLVAPILLVLGIFAGVHYLDRQLEPANIAEQSRQLLGTPLKLAQKPEWSLFPPRIVFHNLEWQFDSDSLSGYLKIPEGSISIELFPLLQGRFAFSEASFEESTASLQIKSPSPATGKGSARTSQTSGGINAFSLKKLNIRQGGALFQTGKDKLAFSGINLAAENLAANVEGSLKSDFTIAWRKGDSSVATLAGKTALSGNFNFSPASLALKQATLLFAPEGKSRKPFAITLAGELELNSLAFRISEGAVEYGKWNFSLSGQGREGDFSGNARIMLKDYSTPENAPLSASAGLKFSAGSLQLPNLDIELLGNQGHGQLAMNFFNNGASPLITGLLDFPILNLDGLEKSSASAATTPGEAKKTSLSLPDMDLRVKILKLVWRKLEFTDINMPFQTRENVASIPAAHFGWAGGLADATFTTDLKTAASELRLHADHLDMGAALAQLGLNGISGGKATISGHLSATGSNWGEISSTLAGRVQIAGKDAKIEVLQKIASSLPAFLNAQNLVPDTVDTLSANCAANMGVLYCRDLSATANSLQCAGSATLDLHNNQVDGSMNFKIGKLELPIVFKGALDDIAWRPGSGFLERLRELLP